MDSDIIVLLILAILIVLVSLLLLLLLIRWLCKKGTWGKVVSILMLGGITYMIVTAIWPLKGFYIDEFVCRSGLTFPKSAVFLYKSATYPDFHGDYSSEAVFTVSEADFEYLKNEILKRRKDGLEKPWMPSFGKIRQDQCLMWENISEKIDQHLSWGLMNDGRTVFFVYNQT